MENLELKDFEFVLENIKIVKMIKVTKMVKIDSMKLIALKLSERNWLTFDIENEFKNPHVA